MRFLVRCFPLIPLAVAACSPDVVPAPVDTVVRSYLVQLDHRPTAADSTAAAKLGIVSVTPIRLASALLITSRVGIPYAGIAGYQYGFAVSTANVAGPVTVNYASPASSSEQAQLQELAVGGSPAQFSADDTAASVSSKYASLNLLNSNQNIVSITLQPLYTWL